MECLPAKLEVLWQQLPPAVRDGLLLVGVQHGEDLETWGLHDTWKGAPAQFTLHISMCWPCCR